MTQLDRLEALAEKVWTVDLDSNRDDVSTVKDALPDLIRVARAANVMTDEPIDYGHDRVIVTLEHFDALCDALEPLFAEVES